MPGRGAEEHAWATCAHGGRRGGWDQAGDGGDTEGIVGGHEEESRQTEGRRRGPCVPARRRALVAQQGHGRLAGGAAAGDQAGGDGYQGYTGGDGSDAEGIVGGDTEELAAE